MITNGGKEIRYFIFKDVAGTTDAKQLERYNNHTPA